jgi:hypothetical protein
MKCVSNSVEMDIDCFVIMNFLGDYLVFSNNVLLNIIALHMPHPLFFLILPECFVFFLPCAFMGFCTSNGTIDFLCG